jgi:hypothetical protein
MLDIELTVCRTVRHYGELPVLSYFKVCGIKVVTH